MKNRYLLLFVSSIVICFHVYNHFCISCSKLFVWWKDLFGSNYFLESVPFLFSLLLILFVVVDFIEPKSKRLKSILGSVLVIFCIANILFWVYFLFLIQFSFSVQYILLISLNVGLILIIRKSSSEISFF